MAGSHQPGKVQAAGWYHTLLNPDQSEHVYDLFLTDPNATAITATLCWNRAYQDQYPFEPLYEKDSDLRLELWGIHPQDPNQNRLLDISDSVNDNVEHIYRPVDAMCKHYRFIVRYSAAAANPQKYAIAWNAGLDNIAQNPFWYDLNNDGKINTSDRLIYFIIDQNRTDILESIASMPEFHISQERVQTLQLFWNQWRNYLKNWSNLSAISPE